MSTEETFQFSKKITLRNKNGSSGEPSNESDDESQRPEKKRLTVKDSGWGHAIGEGSGSEAHIDAVERFH